jgi:hypothetical protein
MIPYSMHARYYNPNITRFLSVDPGQSSAADPQSWGLYSYVRNSPIVNADPNGTDAIPVAFVKYRVETSVGRLPLGHAGIILIDNKTGATRYFDNGRYDPAKQGAVRSFNTPPVTFGRTGLPTRQSLTALLSAVSTGAGHGSALQGAYFKNGSFSAMVGYAQKRLSQNDDPSRKPYDPAKNNCATFTTDVLAAGGVKTLDAGSPLPTALIDSLQKQSQFSLGLEEGVLAFLPTPVEAPQASPGSN